MIDTKNQIETERLAALKRYDILDTPPEEAFDRITRLAKTALNMPIVLVSLVDANRQWFKSKQGLDAAETPRDISFCTHAIEHNEPLIIRNALEDPRFYNNPLVTGEPYIQFYLGMPLRTPDGHNIGTLCAIDQKPRDLSIDEIGMLGDLARLVIEELEHRRIAITDHLTGAMTKRSFQQDVQKEMDRAQRYNRPTSLIMFDIDHFKEVNAKHGHVAGDALLQNLASICKSNLRGVDLFARLGGEEFAIVLPETNRLSAMTVAEKLRNIIAETPITFRDQELKITASFGITVIDNEDVSIEALLQRTAEAVHRAKITGRNRTVFIGADANLFDVA